MCFFVSVIIPAYNVESFIEKAIVSALQQKEVSEVIIVDDGSKDKTIAIILELQKLNSKIKLFRHSENSNKGRSATRNLGIQKANENYIAFLDADDFYMNDRFKKDQEILEKDPKLEGVYNAVGLHYYRKISEIEKEQNNISTLCQEVAAEELFDAVISSKYGYLHLNGLTLNKRVFDKIGFFNEELLVAEDSDIIYKLALKCKLIGSNIINPVAKRGIHENNIFTRTDLYKIYNIKLYESIIYWGVKNDISFTTIDVTLKWLWVFKFRENNSLLEDTKYWVVLFFKEPKLLFSYLSIKYFPLIRLRQKVFSFLYNK